MVIAPAYSASPSLILSRRQKRKDKRSDIVLETKPKRFGIVPEFVSLKTD
jgi:hypothetical protein